MPAPTIAALLAYELNIEDAYATALDGITTGVQILTSRTTLVVAGELATPRVEISLAVTGTGPQENLRTTDNASYRSHKLGLLTIKVSCRREATSQLFGNMLGFIRGSLLEATQIFDATNLPYYQIAHLVETSSASEIFPGNDEIQSVLAYAIEWWIKPDQWPVAGLGDFDPSDFSATDFDT
jgi:hypothetical protein